jgi:DNA-binding Xre family transcriptional regulator
LLLSCGKLQGGEPTEKTENLRQVAGNPNNCITFVSLSDKFRFRLGVYHHNQPIKADNMPHCRLSSFLTVHNPCHWLIVEILTFFILWLSDLTANLTHTIKPILTFILLLIIVCCAHSHIAVILHTKIFHTMSGKNILEVFGGNVQKYRKAKQISQEKLAEIAGVHRTYVGMIERAEKNITLRNMEKIANALEVEIRDLLEQ